VTFQTRWALSYLRGPLTTAQIQTLMAPHKAALAPTEAPKPVIEPAAGAESPAAAVPASSAPSSSHGPPVLPPDIVQRFAAIDRVAPRNAEITWQPALLGLARVHFVDARTRSGVDEWRDTAHLVSDNGVSAAHVWASAETVDAGTLALQDAPDPAASFAELPSAAAQPKSYARWKTELKDHLYRTERLQLFLCPALKSYSRPGESEGDFRARLQHARHEERDARIDKLRRQYAPKLDRLQDAIRRHQQRVETEQSQASSATMSSAVSFGSTLLSALFGRKWASAGNVSRAATSVRSASRAAEQRGDVDRARQNLTAAQEELRAMEAELQTEIERLQAELSAVNLTLEPYELSPRKADLAVTGVQLVWLPEIAVVPPSRQA
jgi:hypothetical protein